MNRAVRLQLMGRKEAGGEYGQMQKSPKEPRGRQDKTKKEKRSGGSCTSSGAAAKTWLEETFQKA